MAKMYSVKVEKKLLSLLMKSPTHIKALQLDTELFAVDDHRVLATLIKDYVLKYKAPPTKDTIRGFANSKAKNEDLAELYSKAIHLLDALPPVKLVEAEYYFEKAENYYLGRKIYDLGSHLSDKFSQSEVDFSTLRRDLLSKLLTFGDSDQNSTRGYIFDFARERWQDYLSGERGEAGDLIPFGIPSLDEKLGGMKKKFVTLAYSKTGGGKTRLAINLAYNAAKAGYNVIYFSFEMAFKYIASCFDSRMAAIDSKEIIYRKLSKEDKQRLKRALREQVKNKLNIWIVDYAMGAKSSVILEEVALYKAMTGKSPDFVVVDYANIMKPMSTYTNTSERYGSLFEEFHEIAKYLDISLFTGAQEGREKAKQEANAKTRDDENEGTHNIGQSHYMATHCETVLRLKQDTNDRLQSRLWICVDKHRYAPMGQKIPIMARWATTYVGDRVRVEE